MIGRVRRFIGRHRRGLGVLAAIGTAYGVAAFLLLCRNDSLPLTTPELVIALSSSVEEDSSLGRVGGDRLRKAIEITNATHAPLLVTTRIRGTERGLTSDMGQHRIIDSAASAFRWEILDGIALTTRDEAERLRRSTSAHRIVVVTSRSHTRRACATFEQLGFEVTCVSSGNDRWWDTPYSILYESMALIKYRLKGWI